MTREEIFKKNFPQYVTEKGVCLSPFWDLFDAGIEAATFELNKGVIQVLTKENAELKIQIERMKRHSNCKYRSEYNEFDPYSKVCQSCCNLEKWEFGGDKRK